MSDTKQEPYRLNDAELDRLAEKPVLGAELAADRLRWTEAEIDRLRAEVAARTAERDAARRDLCGLSGGFDVEQSRRVAKVRGWDCFDAKEAKP